MKSPVNDKFYKEYETDVLYVKKVLEAFNLCTDDGPTKQLCDACNYSLFSGGKRIRPIIMLETFKLFSKELDKIDPFMAAIEMIHNYSLIHDDLPILDDDDLRRNKPTLHKIYGDDIARLAGDNLLNKSFEIIAKSALYMGIEKPAMRAMLVLSEKAGQKGMLGGQFVDVISQNVDVSEKTLLFIHEHKTGALIEAAFMVGAIIGGAKDEDIEKFKEIGHDIGLAFQIQDDILDVVSTTSALGKPINSDIKNNKSTYVSLYGIKESQERVVDLYDKAVSILSSIVEQKTFLFDLIDYLRNRSR